MTDPIRQTVLKKLTNGDFNCEKEFTLSMFSGKYKLVILWELGHVSEMHFNELYRLIDHVTKKVLANQLRELVSDQLIKRTAYERNNQKLVIYQMTEIGESLLPIIDQMYEWGKQRLNAYQIPAAFKLDVAGDISKDA
ncbi:transcriptional regulator [Lentilactobacillus fungorum]|uniref:Transcriptional regulator n=1 Tax=Lentilactobacillus fungorum TaxID=2201250 RepID=A0ABQ3W1X9_9LACO|nr:helix-turn-helix domain-containing protein [Lentilactobacillus fungorum]GHP14447.1 transcriptional regulator [Lentilactobacillus fungorum]